MVKYVLLRTLRPEIYVSWSSILGLPFLLLLLFYFRCRGSGALADPKAVVFYSDSYSAVTTVATVKL
jgi:hypothetical protein